MGASSQQTGAGTGRQEICRFLLPSASSKPWVLDIPADLQKCVGRYARVPDFAQGGHLLRVVKLTQEQAP